jgi:hypothetical protein
MVLQETARLGKNMQRHVLREDEAVGTDVRGWQRVIPRRSQPVPSCLGQSLQRSYASTE